MGSILTTIFVLLLILWWCRQVVQLEEEDKLAEEKKNDTITSEERDEEEELNFGVFNVPFVEALELSFNGQLTSTAAARPLLSKLGKIGLYLRIYRAWSYSPATGHHGFYRYFPQPSVSFHNRIYTNCSTPTLAGFIDCVNLIFGDIQQRAVFMFPLIDQKVDEFYQIDEDDFNRRVSNTKFNFDMSASYLLCFLTKHRLSILERLPFCGYGPWPHQNQRWPAGPFRQYQNSPELWPGQDRPTEELDPIDELWEQREFECADVSFCPDPCCGRNDSTRFFRGSSNQKDGWCAHSTCSMNVQHLNEDIAKQYFVERHRVEQYRNKSRADEELEEGSGTTTGAGGNGTDAEQDFQSQYSAVNTHYCYLEESFNDDFQGIMENRWNLSCACAFDNGTINYAKIYRADVRQCVDLDECIYEECPGEQQCVNQADGYSCECPVGHYRQQDGGADGQCRSIEFDGMPENLFKA